MSRQIPWIALCWICNALPSVAHAGNDDSYFMGSTAGLIGGAMVAHADDPSAVWYNPAGIGHIRRQQFDLSMTAAAFQWRRIERGLVARYSDQERAITLDGSRTAVVTPSTAYVRRWGGFTLGAGLFVTVDDGLETRGYTQWQSESERQILVADVNVSQSRYHAGVALGWQLASRLRVGFGLFGVYETSERSFVHGVGWDTGAFSVGEQRDLAFEATRYGVQASGGLQLDLGAGLSAGLLLRSPIVLVYESGRARALTTSALAGELRAQPVSDNRVTLDEPGLSANELPTLLAPARVVLGAGYRTGILLLSVEAELAHGLQVGQQTDTALNERYLVNRGPLYNVRAGALWNVVDAVQVGVGVFSDHNAQRGPLDVAEFAVDYYGVTGGVRFEQSIRLHEDEREPQLKFATSLGVRYAYGQGLTGQLYGDLQELEAPSIRVAAHTPVRFHELHLQIGSGFQF